jgi:hypothetical protein
VEEEEQKVWNDTIANLSLMALGSSAPEILLSVIGVVTALGEEADGTSPKHGLLLGTEPKRHLRRTSARCSTHGVPKWGTPAGFHVTRPHRTIRHAG